MNYYYYKVPEYNLYGGEHLLTILNKDINDFLDRHGIKVVLNLAREQYQLKNGIEIKTVYLEGTRFERSQIDCCIAIISESLRQNKPILVHCSRGIDRTGCIIGSYLCYEGMPFDKVKTFLLSCFPEYRKSEKYLELYEPYFAIIKSYDGTHLSKITA